MYILVLHKYYSFLVYWNMPSITLLSMEMQQIHNTISFRNWDSLESKYTYMYLQC